MNEIILKTLGAAAGAALLVAIARAWPDEEEVYEFRVEQQRRENMRVYGTQYPQRWTDKNRWE
jgi:hypothetical protein